MYENYKILYLKYYNFNTLINNIINLLLINIFIIIFFLESYMHHNEY